jgi:alpha-galactosidase
MGFVNVALAQCLLITITFAVLHYETTPNGFGAPARGWNSFGLQAYGDKKWILNEANVLSQCKLLAEKFGSVGYTYCSLDSGWSRGYDGDEYGRIIADVAVFPDMKAFADQLHNDGLKLGIYINVSRCWRCCDHC